MKLTASILTLCAAARLTSAAPLDGALALQKRALVYQTKIVNVVETVTKTTTITLGQTPSPSPSPSPSPLPSPLPKKPDAGKKQPPAAVPAKVTPTTTSTPTPTPSPPPPASPSPIVAHQDPQPQLQQPKPEQPQPQPQQPKPEAQPTPQAQTPPSADSGSSGASSGSSGSSFKVETLAGASVPDGPGPFKATATYYTVGLGACGTTNSDSEMVLAISHLMMGTSSNGNPLCGRFVSITGTNGQPVRAKVVDKCMDCHDSSPTGPHNIDLSPALFKALGDADGVMDVTWDWVS